MKNADIALFKSGVHSLLDDENIPNDAASDEKNWYTHHGNIKLIPGRVLVGAEGASGAIYGEIFGYKVNGTKVHYRKTSTKIQYFDGTTWQDIIIDLTADSDYTFANYSSLAGTFTYAFGVDGIYKIHNAYPGTYKAMYNATYNFKGYAFIDKGRTILWGRTQDKTGLYGSKIDPQGSNYTSVSAEVLGASGSTTYSGTLAAVSGTRNCFALSVTGTTGGGAETFTDNYDGTLTGSLGGTGTINYLTGAYSVTFNGAVTSGNVTANYQWEDSNSGGVTDFRKSATRVAAEGFVVPQDEGGDAIQCVLIGQDGAYYSLKKQSAYRFEIDSTDLNPTNEVYRRDIGVPSPRGAVSTGKGIVFVNTAKYANPELTVLQRNPLGDSIEPVVITPHFDFSEYNFTDCSMDTHDRYVLIACRTTDATANDRILLVDIAAGTVDITAYPARTFAKDSGTLYCGSSITQSTYKIYDGYDDDGLSIDNYWESNGETFKSKRLKKYKWLRLKGRIDPDQSFEVYISYDDAGYQLVGTVRGDASYVDFNEAQELGSNTIGAAQIGGDGGPNAFPYYVRIKLKTPKFRKRKIKFVALGIGYVDIDTLLDEHISEFEDKVPKRFRLKQNVSLSGQSTDVAGPQF